jgi:hypothetical protein
MIHVDFDPTQLTGEQKDWWDAWCQRADSATLAAIKAWEDSRGTISPPWNREVWKDLKDWLLKNVFHHKCAYCETRIDRFYGDAEHYRPKGAVKYRVPDTGEERTAQAEREAGQLQDHPGYFWLAYNWRNLVPSCTFCNSGKGKQNQFPVQKRYVLWKQCTPAQVQQLRDKAYPRAEGSDLYYLGPLDLDQEEDPELLHPYRDQPEEHLGFEAGGLVTWKSDLGESSVKVYQLDDHNLNVARHLAQIAAKTIAQAGYDFWLLWEHCNEQEAWRRTAEGIRGKLEDQPYAAAGCDYVQKYCKPGGID